MPRQREYLPPPRSPLCFEEELRRNRYIIAVFGRVPALSTEEELEEFNQKLEKVLYELAPLLRQIRHGRSPLVVSLPVSRGAINIAVRSDRFPRAEQIYGWIAKKAESLFGIEEVPVIFSTALRPGPGFPCVRFSWNQIVDGFPQVIAQNEAYEELVDALPHLMAQGVPLVDYLQGFRGPELLGPPQVMVITVGLRELKDEYKEAMRAIVEGVEGIKFEFFQAEFTREEIRKWANEIWETFSRPWDLPPGIIEVPVAGTSSSWRCQRITVRIAGQIKPEYIQAVRAVVGERAPLYFQRVGRSLPHHTRYWQEKWGPDELLEKQMLHVFAQLFPEVDLLNMRIGEVEEFIKGLSVEEATELIRKLLDYALERGLLIPEERQELEEEMMQHWRDWRQE